jgi:ATP-binding cassette subfamily B protein
MIPSVRHQARVIAALMYEHRWRYAAGTVFVLVGIAAGLAYPLFVQRLIDQGVMAGRAREINRIGLILLGLMVAEGLSTTLRDYLFNVAAEGVTCRLRQKVFDQLLRQEIAYFDRQNAGEIVARLWGDVPAISRVIGDEMIDAVRFALFGICGVPLLFYLSPRLTLYVMIVVPPLIVASSVLGRRIKALTSDSQQAYAHSGATAAEGITGIRTVRAFGQEEADGRRHRRHLDAALRIARRRVLATSAMSGLSFTFGELGALIALWAGGMLIARGQLTSGQLIGFVLYAFLVARGFRNATIFWADASKGLGATEWIFDLLERQPAPPRGGSTRIDPFAGGVAFEGVGFRYPSRPDVEALVDINLRVDPNEVVALVGRSGAGKSTLINLLLRFYEPQAGVLLLDGRDAADLDADWLRRRIGVVMQEPLLFSGTLADNIRYGRPDASDADVEAAAVLARASEFIDRMPQRMATLVGDRGVQLSGGQRQRVAIARAVLRRPAILILDEATSALDAENESFVQDALRALRYRPTTFIVAHRLSSVVNVDRVAVMDRGRIVDVGPHDTLLRTSPLYRQLVETQLVEV